MFHRKLSVGPSHHLDAPSAHRGFSAAGAAIGLVTLAGGGLYSSTITAQLGLFPTLFMATVVAVCVAMQLAELTAPHQPLD